MHLKSVPLHFPCNEGQTKVCLVNLEMLSHVSERLDRSGDRSGYLVKTYRVLHFVDGAEINTTLQFDEISALCNLQT